MFNNKEFKYFHSILVAEYFYCDSKVTTLNVSEEQLNLQATLEEVPQFSDNGDHIKQILAIDGRETQQLMLYRNGFSDINVLEYFNCFYDVLKREDNVRKTGFLHTFNYNGSGAISDSQLLQAYMTFFGINLVTFENYLDLINLTDKFSDS